MPPLTLTNTAAATLRFVRRRREQVETQARLRVAALASAASVAVLALRERRRKTPGKAPFVSRARPLAKFILRKTMHDLTAMLTDSAFKLKYRVTKQVFAKIHADILPLIEGHAKGSRCYNSSSGKVSTEVMLALTLRYLAGGSYLDIHTETGVSRSHFFRVVWKVVDAIDRTYSLDFPMPLPSDSPVEATRKALALAKLAAAFENKSTNGVIKNAVGMIDGLLIRITNPGVNVLNPKRCKFLSALVNRSSN